MEESSSLSPRVAIAKFPPSKFALKPSLRCYRRCV